MLPLSLAHYDCAEIPWCKRTKEKACVVETEGTGFSPAEELRLARSVQSWLYTMVRLRDKEIPCERL